MGPAQSREAGRAQLQHTAARTSHARQRPRAWPSVHRKQVLRHEDGALLVFYGPFRSGSIRIRKKDEAAAGVDVHFSCSKAHKTTHRNSVGKDLRRVQYKRCTTG